MKRAAVRQQIRKNGKKRTNELNDRLTFLNGVLNVNFISRIFYRCIAVPIYFDSYSLILK
jgi:hypothetical protein